MAPADLATPAEQSAAETQPAPAVAAEAPEGMDAGGQGHTWPASAGMTTHGAVAEAAEPQAKPEPLDTLAQVMRKVWSDNPLVRQAFSALEGTGYDISTARTGYFPYLQISSAFAEKEENASSTLVAVLPLWSGGSTGAEVDQAKARQRAALADITRTRLQLGQRTVEAYLNVAMAQEQTIQWSNYLGNLKKLLATIGRRADQGVAPTSDVQTAVTRLRQAEVGSVANSALLLTSRTQLASLLDVTPGAVDWPDESYLLSEDEANNANARIELHPDRLRALTDVDLQDAVARESRAEIWPQLSLQHRRQLEGLTFDPTNDDATLLVLQFQSTNGLRGFRGMQAEEQRLNAARARVDSATREVSSTLNIDRAQLRAVASQLLVQEQAAIAAATLVESFTRQYEVGRRSWLEVLNALREAHETTLQSVGLKRAYWLANCKLALDALYWHRLGAEAEPAVVAKTEESAP